MDNRILATEDLRETSDYIESLSNASDNTYGEELDNCTTRTRIK